MAAPDRSHRLIPAPRLGLVLLLVSFVVVPFVGCGSTTQEGSTLTVYLSGSESSAEPAVWRDVRAGAELARERADGEAGGVPVLLVALDDAGTGDGAGAAWSQSRVAAGARVATEDSTSIAYIGELTSRATQISAPITNEAGLLQLAPTAVDEELLRDSPGSDGVPAEVQGSGERTLGALLEEGVRSLPEPAPSFARAFAAEAGRPPGPAAAYGYEAMALVLDSIDRATDPLDRSAVIEAFLATSDRESILGPYSVDAVGATTIGR